MQNNNLKGTIAGFILEKLKYFGILVNQVLDH